MKAGAGVDVKKTGKGRRGGTRGAYLLEVFLWVAGIAIASVLLTGVLQARAAMRVARRIGEQQVQAAAPEPTQGQRASDNPLPAGTPIVHGAGAVIGRLEIPQISLSVPILENYDPDSLKRGVGRIPGTATPGGLGNLGLAGHRDTFLRAVRHIKAGMEADVVTSEGRYRYQVDTFEIVTPDQVEVLDIRGRPEMTLITCYPFDYIGPAPKRFIVHAHLLSLDPSRN